jgi:hypothetical protein
MSILKAGPQYDRSINKTGQEKDVLYSLYEAPYELWLFFARMFWHICSSRNFEKTAP